MRLSYALAPPPVAIVLIGGVGTDLTMGCELAGGALVNKIVYHTMPTRATQMPRKRARGISSCDHASDKNHKSQSGTYVP